MTAFTAESLFERYLWPLYPDDARQDLARARTTDANPAANPGIVAHLGDAARVFEAMAPALFGKDDPKLDRTDASVHRLSRALTRARRDAWASRGVVGTADNELFNVIVHGAAYVGECVAAQHGGRWSVRRPLWESLVTLDSRAGTADLAVLQWLLKSLADDALAANGDAAAPILATTLADRYRTHVETPCFDPEALPRLVALTPGSEGVAPTERRIPRLTKVRYASLHQHLRAHVPEIRDLGPDFPSPERFEDLRLTWLDFAVVGDGRMVLLFGPSEGGAHLFWLTGAGFEKSAHFPGDSFPAPVLNVLGDKLRVLVQVDGRLAAHEMLWWGL
jgi:hypothetical protein